MDSEIDINKLFQNISPIIYGSNVTFIFHGNAELVYLVGDYNRWEQDDKMFKHPTLELWYITKCFPENSRFDYKYVVDGSWITDPLNKNVTPGGGGYNSTLIMPKYHSDYDKIINTDVPRGNLIKDLKLNSKHLKSEANYHVYLPYDYSKDTSGHIMYAMDGSDYINFSQINLVLDYMIYKNEIPSMPVILVDPAERNRDYTIYKPYYKYMTDELMPFVERNYFSSSENLDRSIIGVSWGGLTAIYLTIMSKYKFRRVLSQSGSFWPRNYKIYDLTAKAITPDIKFCLQAGTIQDTEEMNDPMFEILTKKKYEVEYVKYAESHSWGNWKGHLNEGLISIYSDTAKE